ncbi:hypothetical protein M413DRAFT_245620 [Hebeloma cylindrosporum]|uniref:Uncharacterized protein n=1 Tax=Hebeloma cylindrosporum TaxID=76867 RepID=A0A0C2YBJ7_HEBCY|nr:hypothetical protein M413DRAFT_245620 [Hebeloma cylindrosporum h7]
MYICMSTIIGLPQMKQHTLPFSPAAHHPSLPTYHYIYISRLLFLLKLQGSTDGQFRVESESEIPHVPSDWQLPRKKKRNQSKIQINPTAAPQTNLPRHPSYGANPLRVYPANERTEQPTNIASPSRTVQANDLPYIEDKIQPLFT